jgi:hypothetical protein
LDRKIWKQLQISAVTLTVDSILFYYIFTVLLNDKISPWSASGNVKKVFNYDEFYAFQWFSELLESVRAAIQHG